MSKLLVNLSILLSQPTGISNYAQNIYPALKCLEPTLLGTERLVAEEYSNFNCHLVPSNMTPAQGSKGHLRRLIWTQFRLPQIYQQYKSQLLFSPLPEAPLYSQCSSIVTVHDAIPLRFPKRFSPLTPYHRYYIPQVLKQAVHIICNSEATAKDITNFYHINSKKITFIHLAHNKNHFHPIDKNKPKNQTKIKTPYFLYVGRQDPYKNLHRLIAAFAKLPNYQEYQLYFAGPKDKRYTPQLEIQALELGVSKQINFLDYVPYNELPIIISNAIALVFPSLWEGFGFPVLEAMSIGTPVITSNISSLPEVAGDAAILVNPYNTDEISNAMQIVATENQTREQMIQKGLKQANRFSWEKTGQATVQVLEKYM
ncbi:MAG: glycosyltransferase family 1 protein [Cyanobacteria bacterium P01_A01_bin.84]